MTIGGKDLKNKRIVKAINKESFFWLIGIFLFFSMFAIKMGTPCMFRTMMATAHDLLINTVFSIMGVAVLAGALSAVFSEFGIVSIINTLLSPLMKPLFDLPGAASVGIITTYLSDNPAIIALGKDEGFKKYFKKYQMPALTNLGTAFGMGLIVSAFMISQAHDGESYIPAVLIGNLGAFIGSIISVKLMLKNTKKAYGSDEPAVNNAAESYDVMKFREVRDGSVFQRFLESILDGGKVGVDLGLEIIPGVLIICTFIMMLTNGPSADGSYTGAAYEGIKVLPWIGEKLSFIVRPLLGFAYPEAIAFPVTALGSAGAALGLVPKFLKSGVIGQNEIAVFTAMGMCWSGYLSTHVAMMDALDARYLTNKAILSHTIGGLCAGISAHFIYLLFSLI